MANRKPIQITEIPKSVKDNQWLVVKMDQPLVENPDFSEFCDMYGADLSDFLHKNIGNFLGTVLLPEYLKMIKEPVQGRYGFDIPKTNINELIYVSQAWISEEIEHIIDTILTLTWQQFKDDYNYKSSDAEETITYFKERGFLANDLIKAVADSYKMKFSDVKKGLQRSSYYITTGITRIGQRQIRGIRLNVTKYKEDMEKAGEVSKAVEDEVCESLLEQENFATDWEF